MQRFIARLGKWKGSIKLTMNPITFEVSLRAACRPWSYPDRLPFPRHPSLVMQLRQTLHLLTNYYAPFAEDKWVRLGSASSSDSDGDAAGDAAGDAGDAE